MLVLDAFRHERWQPDLFQSQGTGAGWVRLVAVGAGELSNHLGGVRFEEDPIEWVACEECARERCGSGAHARVTRTGSHLLFTPPDARDRSPYEVRRVHPLLLVHGALALSLDRWSELQDELAGEGLALPHETSFELAGWRELWAAWVSQLPPLLRQVEPKAFAPALARTLPPRLRESQARELDVLARLAAWFRRGAPDGSAGGFVEPSLLQTPVRPVVLDERTGESWAAFAEAPTGEVYPAFGSKLALLAHPAPARVA